MNVDNPLCHNDGKWHRHIINIDKVINDDGPWWVLCSMDEAGGVV